MKNSYVRVILPYEVFCERVKNSPNMALAKHHDHTLKTHTNIQTSMKTGTPANGKSATGSPPSSPLSDTSSPLSEPPDDGEHRKTKKARQGSQDRHSGEWHFAGNDPDC